jgi:hypothetical protein
VVEVRDVKDALEVLVDAEQRDGMRLKARTQPSKLVQKCRVDVRDLDHVDHCGAVGSERPKERGYIVFAAQVVFAI